MMHDNYTPVPQRHLYRPAQSNAGEPRNAQSSAAHDPDHKKSNLPTKQIGAVDIPAAAGKCTKKLILISQLNYKLSPNGLPRGPIQPNPTCLAAYRSQHPKRPA